MSTKLDIQLEKIEKFKKKKDKNSFYSLTLYYDESEENDYKKYRKLHGETINFCKTIVLAIFKEKPNCEDLLEDKEFYFLQDIEYSENKMSYDEDMNLLIEDSPSSIINYLTTILEKLNR